MLLVMLLTTASVWAGDLTGFLPVSSSGTATANFTFSDHFYKVEWSGINTSATTSVLLHYDSRSGYLQAERNDNTSSTINLYPTPSSSTYWNASDINSLTPGQSSDGYTKYETLAAGATSQSPVVYKKVCTVTSLATNAPTWTWAADLSTCTASFTCADDASLTATVTATVTASDGILTASATFNGTTYTDTKTDHWGVGSGNDGSADHPYTISSPDGLVLLADYVNSGHDANGLTFVQTQDIDMSNYSNFTPIGSKANDFYPTPFNGTYDGQGNAIISLYVNTESPYAGLFGYLEGTVRNVTMVNPFAKSSYNGNRYAGGIVGAMKPGTITDCNVINPTLQAIITGAICGGIAHQDGNISGGYFYTTSDVNAVEWNAASASVTATRIYTLTLADGITTSTAPTFSYGGTDYYDGTITLPAAPTGWNYTYSVNGSAINGNTFDISADASVTVAHTPINYNITYNLNGGSNVSGNPATYNIQSATITLATPTRTGYTFGGWYANSGLTGNAVTTIATGSTGNVELWAKWTAMPYTLTYNLNVGTNASGNPATYTVESATITLADATRTGYAFGGWYDNSGLTGSAVTTIATGSTGDKTLWAKWTANEYTVAFDGNGATDGSMSTLGFNYDAAQALPACAFTLTGYHLARWNIAADGSGTSYTDGQSVQNLTAENGATVTLYAQWEANTYTVHFDPVIHVNGEMADQTFNYDQAATALSKNQFSITTGEWLGWNTQADGKGTAYADKQQVRNLTTENGGTVTLYAQWHLQHSFYYNNSIFRCYSVSKPNEAYRAYKDEKVKVEVVDATHQYTIYVTGEDGTEIDFNTTDNTFTMPDQDVNITSTSLKHMAYTSILLDGDDGYNIVYLYDANQSTVTPTVVVKDGETLLTEGTHYNVAITNNTGNATEMVTATVTVTGIAAGGYVGTTTKEFHITPFNIANCDIRGTLEAYDDGYGPYYPLSENVEVWNGETKLENYTDYDIEIEYADSYGIGQTYQATIIGQGNWGGSNTFTFTMVTLHHAVVFDANGGTGTMASTTLENNGGQPARYTLPACGFTAPPYLTFDHWEVSCEPGEEKQPDDYFTAPFIWSKDDVLTITVTAHWKAANPLPAVTYIDADGTTQTKQSGEYTLLYSGNMPDILAADWYVVSGIVNYDSGIPLSDDVNLILADGCTMNIGSDGDGRISGTGISGNTRTLTIYGQSAGTGALNIYTTDVPNNGIIANNLTINGGHVTATAESCALYALNDLTINGGKVDATGSSTGIQARDGSITLGWTNPNDYIKANNYAGTVTIKSGQTFIDEDGTLHTPTNIGSLDGKTLQPVLAVTLGDGIIASSGIIISGDDYYAKVGQTVTLGYSGEVPAGYDVIYSYNDGNDDHTISGNTFVMPAADVTVSVTVGVSHWAGTGAADDPYIIEYPCQLDLLAQRVNSATGDADAPMGYFGKYFQLGDDIAYDANTPNNFTPIGTDRHSFKGTFLGNGKKITGIRINDPSLDYAGLFGFVESATLDGVAIEDASITANQYCGVLAGCVSTNTTIERCMAVGTVSGSRDVGGLFGILAAADISECFALVDATGSNTYYTQVGGFVGTIASAAQISDCYCLGTAKGVQRVGGFAGYMYNDEFTITRCYAAGAVDGSGNYVGAFVGYPRSVGIITDCATMCNGIQAAGTNASGTSDTQDGVAELDADGMKATANFTAWLTLDPAIWTQTDGLTQPLLAWNVTNGLTVYTSASGSGKGSVSVTADSYAPGSTVTVSAVADKSSFFVGWTGTAAFDDPTNATTTIVLDNHHVVTAPFGKLISTPAELQAVNNDLSGIYALDYHIDLTGIDWTPIGNARTRFTGKFYGRGYSITNMVCVNDPSDQGRGLFGGTQGATLDGITVSGIVYGTTYFVGGLVGVAEGTLITNCHANCAVYNASVHTGVLAGSIAEGTVITGCSAEGTVNAANDCAGGLVGICGSGSITIRNCVSSAEVIVNGKKTQDGVEGKYVGGLIGFINSDRADISGCRADGYTSGYESVGGFVGRIGDSGTVTINNCVARGDVRSTSINYGGFIGYNYNTNATISNCWSSGAVWGTGGNIGAFVGLSLDETIKDCSVYPYSPGPRYFCGSNVTIQGGIITATEYADLTKDWPEVKKHISGSIHISAVEESFDALSNPLNARQFLTAISGATPISTAEEFQAIGTDATSLAGCYVLVNDIDLSGIDFTPVGNADTPFTGELYGQGHRISGYTLETEERFAGLFGNIAGGRVNGVLAVEGNVSRTGDTNKTVGVGGFAGQITSKSLVDDCSFFGTVSNTAGGNTGGFVGRTDDMSAILRCCVPEGSVTDESSKPNTGGFVGNHGHGYIVDAYAIVEVTDNYPTSPSDYKIATGGFAGYVGSAARIANAWCSGQVSSLGSYLGAFVGQTHNDCIITNSYYDNTRNSGMLAEGTIGAGSSKDHAGITGIEQESMSYPESFPDFDFVAIWMMDEYPVFRLWTVNMLELIDDEDNTTDIAAANGKMYNVTLQGRTLYKDGAWNTLCLPFDVSTTSGTLAGDNVVTMTLNGSTSKLTDGTLTLNFDAAPATIPAGTPFIIKWATPEAPAADLVSPTFTSVTIKNETPANNTVVSADGSVSFIGTNSPVDIYTPSKTNYYLGGNNKLYYPWGNGMTSYYVNAFRAYFQLNDLTAGDPMGPNPVKAFVLNFGNGGDVATGICSMDNGQWTMDNEVGAWYDMSGRKVSPGLSPVREGRKLPRGIYIHNGKKTMVK